VRPNASVLSTVTRRTTDRLPNNRLLRYGLTAGEMGSAGGQTLIAVLLPILLAPHAPSTFWIGAVIATEGLFALTLPYVAGALSDSMPVRFGRFFGPRGALLGAVAPFLAGALLFISFRDSFLALAGFAALYFAALHLYATPLRAQLIDATPQRHWGAVQGVMGATHLAGVTFGLVAGGLLFSIWEHLPFLVGGALVIATSAITLYCAWRLDLGGNARAAAGPSNAAAGSSRIRQEIDFWKELLVQSGARRVLLANALWNAGVEGIRPYIFLFATVVVGIAVPTASLAMLAFLVAATVGSVVVGRIGDRVGRAHLLLGGALVAGVAMLPGLFVRDLLALTLLLVPAGLGAAALVSLPYAVFESAAGQEDVGRSTGTFYMSVGIARLVGPLLIGAVIDLAAAWLPEQQGYPAMWPVAGALILLGALTLHRAIRTSASLGRTRRQQHDESS
jgi:MFS family permease